MNFNKLEIRRLEKVSRILTDQDIRKKKMMIMKNGKSEKNL